MIIDTDLYDDVIENPKKYSKGLPKKFEKTNYSRYRVSAKNLSFVCSSQAIKPFTELGNSAISNSALIDKQRVVSLFTERYKFSEKNALKALDSANSSDRFSYWHALDAKAQSYQRNLLRRYNPPTTFSSHVSAQVERAKRQIDKVLSPPEPTLKDLIGAFSNRFRNAHKAYVKEIAESTDRLRVLETLAASREHPSNGSLQSLIQYLLANRNEQLTTALESQKFEDFFLKLRQLKTVLDEQVKLQNSTGPIHSLLEVKDLIAEGSLYRKLELREVADIMSTAGNRDSNSLLTSIQLSAAYRNSKQMQTALSKLQTTVESLK